jgi:hypothetical protein
MRNISLKAKDFKIDEMVKDNFDEDLYFYVDNIEPWKYYIVEVKFFKSNPKHKAIMRTKGYKLNKDWYMDNESLLFNTGYEGDTKKINMDKVYWFRIIQELDME